MLIRGYNQFLRWFNEVTLYTIPEKTALILQPLALISKVGVPQRLHCKEISEQIIPVLQSLVLISKVAVHQVVVHQELHCKAIPEQIPPPPILQPLASISKVAVHQELHCNSRADQFYFTTTCIDF